MIAMKPPSPVAAAIVLPPSCTIREIAVLQECLRGAPLGAALDGSAVRRIDSAGVKLLMAFIRERRVSHGEIRWRGASAVLSDAVIGLGVANAVNLPAAS
jgi:anti-anti-sigma regulatory factor